MVECSSCRRQLGDGQAYSGECGQPTVRKDAPVNFFDQFVKFSPVAVSGLVAVVAIMAFLGASRTNTAIVPKPSNISPAPVEIETTALAKAFHANEIRAEQQNQGVPLKVRGRITGIGKDLGSPASTRATSLPPAAKARRSWSTW